MKYELVIFDASGTLYDLKTNEVFEAMYKLLPALKKRGVKIAMATNLGRGSADKFLDDSELVHIMDYMACADDAPFKPAPDMLEMIMDEAWIQPENTIMVGDSLEDMQAAQAAGIAGCLATWNSDADMQGLIPEYNTDKIQDLWRILGVSEL